MNIEKWKIRTKLHDHGNYATSKFGVIFIGYNWEGKRTLMCLHCGTTWTIEDGKAPAGYWVCPVAGCNEVFKTGFKDKSDVGAALWAIMTLWRPFTVEGEYMTDCLIELQEMINGTEPLRKALPFLGPNGPVEVSWEDELEGILDNIADAKVKPGHFGTELALNTIRHYVAHLWEWFEAREDCPVDHEAILAKATSFADGPALHQ